MQLSIVLLLLMIHSVVIFAAEKSTEPDVIISPAWGGLFRQGYQTEVRVTLSHFAVNHYIIVIEGAGLTVKTPAAITSSKDKSFVIPVQLSGKNYLTLKIIDESGSELIDRKIWFNTISQFYKVMIEPVVDNQTQSNATIVGDFQVYQSSIDTMATGLVAMDMVDGVLLKYNVLKQLNEQQIKILFDFLHICGAIITMNFPQGVYDKFQKYAQCHTQQLQRIEDMSSLQQALNKIITPVHFIDEDVLSIQKKLNKEGNVADRNQLLVLFFSIYFLFMIVSITFKRCMFSPIIVSIGFSGFFLLYYQTRTPVIDIINWVEINQLHSSQQAQLIQVRSLLNFSNHAKDELSFQFDEKVWSILSLQHNPSTALFTGENKRLQTMTSIISESHFFVKSHHELINPLRIGKHEGNYQVANVIDYPIGPGMILVNNEKYYFERIAAHSEIVAQGSIKKQQLREFDRFKAIVTNDGNDSPEIIVKFELAMWHFDNALAKEQTWLHINNLKMASF